MINQIYAFIFVIVSFFTWCSVIFWIADMIWGEETLFANLRYALLTYLTGILFSVVMTFTSYIVVFCLQNLRN